MTTPFATRRATGYAMKAPSASAPEALLRAAVAAFADKTEHPVRVVGLESAHERLVQLTIEQANVQQFIEVEQKRENKLKLITQAMLLQGARGLLLQDVKRLLIDGNTVVTPNQQYAVFRLELKELASEWGYKIVLVGNKDYATLVEQ